MDTGCLTGILVLTGAIVAIVAMFLNYKAKFDKSRVVLEKNDQHHEQKHQENERKIKILEDKNGSEQHQIDELKEKINQLEGKLGTKKYGRK